MDRTAVSHDGRSEFYWTLQNRWWQARPYQEEQNIKQANGTHAGLW